MKRAWLAALLVWSWLLSPARAEDSGPEAGASGAPPMTQRGRTMVFGAVGGFWSNDNGGLASYARWNVNLRPGALYFLRNNLGLGGSLGVGYSERKTSQVAVDAVTGATISSRSKAVEVALTLEGMWAVPLAARWSLLVWPSIGYVYLTAQRHTEGLPSTDAREESLAVRSSAAHLHLMRFGLACPFVYALSPSVGLGLGPDFAFDLALAGDDQAGGAAGPRGLLLGAKAGVYASF